MWIAVAALLVRPFVGPFKSLRALGWKTAETWRRAVAHLGDPYRPELHYMRGPGPKWQAKHRTQGPR